MTRDYKNVPKSSDRKKKRKPKKKAVKQQAKPIPGWIWLLTGLGIGLIVALFVYIYDRSEGSAVNTTAPPIKKQVTKKRPKPEETKSRFDFYTLLPELEVIIPESEIREQQNKLKPKENVNYLLQVGSFRNYDEADSLKARLALLGIEAGVQSVSNKGEEWLRVRVGPFTNKRELNKIRNRLHSNDINTLLIKTQKQ
jgi:cell division protein FtsN